MKFGRRVRFIVNDELLSEYEIASNVKQLSEVLDTIHGKSNVNCMSDLLAAIKESMNQKANP